MTLYQRGNPEVLAHLSLVSPSEVGITLITLQEQARGRLAAINAAKTPSDSASAYRRFAETLVFVPSLPIMLYGDADMRRFQDLRRLKLKVSSMDL